MARQRRGKRPKMIPALTLPWLLAETVWSSVQTIGQRTRLIAEDRCTAAEYTRMVSEKAAAAQETAAALARLRGPDGALALVRPWHRRTTANARRLSKP